MYFDNEDMVTIRKDMNMKMYFDNDDMVTIRKEGDVPKNIKKQDISDFLIESQIEEDEYIKSTEAVMGVAPQQNGIEIIEKAVILSNLNNVVSIKLTEDEGIVQFYPTRMKLRISEEIWNFLNFKLNN